MLGNMDNTNSLLREKMKKRRAALEATIMSETGSYASDADDTMRGTASPGDFVTPARATTTEIEALSPAGEESLVETVEDLEAEDDMLQDLQARRQKMKEEVSRTMDSTGGGAWGGEDVETRDSAAASPGPSTLGVSGPRVQKIDSRQLSTSSAGESVNLNASIRERLRSKVRGRQAGSPEAEPGPERRLRGLRDRPLPTRFDDAGLVPPDEEEEGQDVELQESIASANRWKKMVLLSKQKAGGMPTEEEAYNFFVGSIETEEEPREDLATPPEDERPLGGLLTEWSKPLVIPLSEQLDTEGKLYKIHSSLPAPYDKKMPEGREPRHWEDEGFYVGKPPPVAPANLNIMENRLLEVEQGRLWFGEDGQLKRLANPLKENPTRPPIITSEELDPLLQSEWVKAQIELFDGRYIDGLGEDSGQYQLDVDVSTLVFTHHPLFSREHVLSSRLHQSYTQYSERGKKAVSSHLTDKLTALKMALEKLEDSANVMGKRKSKSVPGMDTNKRIQEYRKQIREIRKLRDVEDYNNRVLLKSILKCWRDIKALRGTQGYTNTSVKLTVRKEETNKEEEEALFEQDLAEELQDRRADFQAGYQERLAAYEIELKEWKKLVKRKKNKQQERGAEGEQSSLVKNENSEGIPARPSKPVEFDDVSEYERIKENAWQRRRRPGEPILIPELHSSANITPTEQCPRLEKQRRAEVQNWSSFVKVLFNNKEVSRTTTKRLTSDFTIHFGEIHSIQILQWPERITLQVCERGVPHKVMAENFLPIPEVTQLSGRVEVESLEFSSSQHVLYKHEGVGSGQLLEFPQSNEGDVDPPVVLLTSGKVMVSASWAVDNDGNTLAPPHPQGNVASRLSAVKRYDALAALGAAGMVDIQKLAKWIEQSHLDPNDPANADIMNIMKIGNAMLDGSDPPRYFRLNQLEEETELTSMTEIDKSNRFKMIQLRNQGVPEFKNFKMIPSRDRDIPDKVFEAYEKRQRGEQEDEVEDERGSHRLAVSKFINKVREEVTQRSLVAKRQVELKDMIIEDEVPDIGTLGVRVAGLFAPRRPLRPVRKERKVVGAQNLTVSDVTVLVNIVRALDIPVRSENQQTRGAPGPGGRTSMRGAGTDVFSASGGAGSSGAQTGQRTAPDPPREPMVRPFVEVMFQGNFARTSVAEGPNPSWNEELILPFRAPNNDYSPDNLQTVNDMVYLNLFDEVVFNILQDDRQRSTNVHQRLERHWLGMIEIPFSTIYFNNKVEGTFRVDVPPVLLGYRRQKRQTTAGRDMGIISRNDTLLSLFVTIEPPLQPSQQMSERFESNESETLVHNAQLWLAPLRKKFPKREFKTLATDLAGNKVFITRFIMPQTPPQELLGQTQREMELLARYVSLVPYVSDSTAFPDVCDIWATSDQFLQMLAGDEEEHAILLCNYFLQRGKKAFVVLGRGIPEGSTSYVLTTDGSYQLWNAHTGEKFDVQDANCPLKSVGCIFNQENIWANVQESEEPYRLSFDVTKPKLWQPFFSKKYPRPALTSVQRELVYRTSDQAYVKSLQDKIEKMLRDKIMSWRPRFVTRWNRYCTQAFRALLSSIEQNVSQANTESHAAELDQILASYKLSGFPINMPFTDIPPVLDAVFSTGVHTIEDPDVEFALAVHVHPYPHGVLSLWVYVGTLRRKAAY